MNKDESITGLMNGIKKDADEILQDEPEEDENWDEESLDEIHASENAAFDKGERR